MKTKKLTLKQIRSINDEIRRLQYKSWDSSIEEVNKIRDKIHLLRKKLDDDILLEIQSKKTPPKKPTSSRKGLKGASTTSLKRSLTYQEKNLANLEISYKNAKTTTQKANLKHLIDTSKASIKAIKKQMITGLNGSKVKGLTTLCAKNIGVVGRRKSDGTQKKGYIAKKGGSLVRKQKVTKK